MKHKILKLSTVILLLLFIGAGCQKDKTLKTDPAKIILGKWELVERGSYPDMRPIETAPDYKEYLPDSVLKRYNSEMDRIFYDIYWIDSLLHQGSSKYRYNFKNNNRTMELEDLDPSTFQNYIYKRIK